MRNKIILGVILVFFLVSRLYKITEIPASVYWDEASIGYNAFAVATDLKDEWGSFLPVHFRAFGEFKLPVYIYSVVPFVKLFGLNALAVRLPAVLYSLGSLILVYLLTKKVTGKESTALLASFIFSISPWLFIFTRTGYEATAGLFFFMLATYFFLFVEKQRYFVLLAMGSFILSFYSYNSFRIIIPLWLPILFIYKFHAPSIIKKNWVVISASIFIFVLSLVPVYRLYKYDAGGARFTEVGVKDKRAVISNYLSNFSPDFLFLKGDANGRSQIPGHGELFLIDLPLILIGLFVCFKKANPYYLIPVILLLLAPIPAALTKESPHALRSLLAAPMYAIIAAIGAGYLSEHFKKYGAAILILIVAGYYLSFESYASDFILKYPQVTASDWQYQYKEIFMNQKSGVVTDEFGQPYIFALFYLKYPPEAFRREAQLNPVDKWGFSRVASFNGFEFRHK